jgi:MiaB-like tRNA modifying enzyme
VKYEFPIKRFGMKVYLEVYGCSANKADAEIIEGMLEERGEEIVKDADKADLLILVTCTVIDSTQQRMLHRLRVLSQLEKKLLVTGCMASAQPDLIKDVAPNALLLEPIYLHHLPELVEGAEEKEISWEQKPKSGLPHRWHPPIATIPIGEGCLYKCSYCITKLARGKLCSYPIDLIKKDVCRAIANGCKEIRLTSQDTAAWGLDKGERLSKLIREICKLDREFWLRIGQMSPSSASKDVEGLIEVYNYPQVFKFLHLPVQSGSDKILELMERGYSAHQFLSIASSFRKEISELTLSTDIIVGFPREEVKDFDKSLALVKEVKPDIVNITRFSSRPKTQAKLMKERVPTQIAKERSRELTKLAKEITYKRNLRFIGKTYEVIVTEEGKQRTRIGRNLAYKPVVLREGLPLGSLVKVKIVDCAPTHLFGEVIG